MCLDRPHGSNTLQDGCVRRLEQKNGGDGCGSGSRRRWLPEPRAGGNGCLSRMENALDGARTEESSHSRSRCRWVSDAGAG